MWVRHLTADKIERFGAYLAEGGLAGQQVGVEVCQGQLGIIVQHLFKVRHKPVVIRAVAVEAAAHHIIHPTPAHPVQCVDSGLQSFLVAAGSLQQQVFNCHGLGEAGRLSPAAFVPVIRFEQRFGRLLERFWPQGACCTVPGAALA